MAGTTGLKAWIVQAQPGRDTPLIGAGVFANGGNETFGQIEALYVETVPTSSGAHQPQRELFALQPDAGGLRLRDRSAGIALQGEQPLIDRPFERSIGSGYIAVGQSLASTLSGLQGAQLPAGPVTCIVAVGPQAPVGATTYQGDRLAAAFEAGLNVNLVLTRQAARESTAREARAAAERQAQQAAKAERKAAKKEREADSDDWTSSWQSSTGARKKSGSSYGIGSAGRAADSIVSAAIDVTTR